MTTIDREGDSHTLTQRRAAVATLLEGIADWLEDKPTVEAGLVEDVARMVERCRDREELRGLSIQLREMASRFRPNAGRVATTEDEAYVLCILETLETE